MHETTPLLLSSYYLDDHDNARVADEAARLGLEYLPSTSLDRDERIRLMETRIHEAEIFLGGRLTAEQFARARRLKWIHVPWAGVNTLLDVESIRESDVLVTNSAGVMAESVADQVMAYLLMLTRDLAPQMRAQVRGEWQGYSVHDARRQLLRGKRLGLVGYGAIGRETARRARAFGMEVVAARRHAERTEPELERVYSIEELDQLLADADFVVIALPLTAETRGMIDARRLKQMKSTGYLINIARGSVVVESDLVEALRSGTIAGAALDVFEKEPLPTESPLWQMENVILTPHSAGGFLGFGSAVVDLFLDNLRRYMAGEEMRNVVDKAGGY